MLVYRCHSSRKRVVCVKLRNNGAKKEKGEVGCFFGDNTPFFVLSVVVCVQINNVKTKNGKCFAVKIMKTKCT
jgi:hypothetical protein